MINEQQIPQTIQQLLNRAQSISGQSLGSLSNQHQYPLPNDPRRDKGWVGQLLESILGASAGSKAIPDFPNLGVELKTIPINARGKPRETTFVCTISLKQLTGKTWQTSLVRQKLAHVLWIPVEADGQLPFLSRRIGQAVLWQPTAEQEAILQRDWQDLTDRLSMGELSSVSAYQGEYLQVRPKAANSRVVCAAIGEEGEPILTLPRGFYLRTCFTEQILAG